MITSQAPELAGGAPSMGEMLGCGGHLTMLRRTRAVFVIDTRLTLRRKPSLLN